MKKKFFNTVFNIHAAFDTAISGTHLRDVLFDQFKIQMNIFLSCFNSYYLVSMYLSPFKQPRRWTEWCCHIRPRNWLRFCHFLTMGVFLGFSSFQVGFIMGNHGTTMSSSVKYHKEAKSALNDLISGTNIQQPTIVQGSY